MKELRTRDERSISELFGEMPEEYKGIGAVLLLLASYHARHALVGRGYNKDAFLNSSAFLLMPQVSPASEPLKVQARDSIFVRLRPDCFPFAEFDFYIPHVSAENAIKEMRMANNILVEMRRKIAEAFGRENDIEGVQQLLSPASSSLSETQIPEEVLELIRDRDKESGDSQDRWISTRLGEGRNFLKASNPA